MWLKLANAVFTNNLGTLSSLTNSYSITYNLTGGVSKTTGATSIPKASGQNYVNLSENFVATFTLGTGAEYTSTSITVGGNALNSSYYSASESNGTVTVTIPTTSAQQITGNIVINVVATQGSAPVVTNYTFTINPTPSTATVTLTASGYIQNGNSITVADGTTVSWSVSASGYTEQTGTWTISGGNKTENITLSASGSGSGEAYWVGEKLSGKIHGTGTASAYLGTQYYYVIDEDAISELSGKAVDKMAFNFASKSSGANTPVGTITVYLVNLNNSAPTNWEAKAEIAVESYSAGSQREFDITPFTVPTGYTIGYRASKSSILGGGYMMQDYKIGGAYYETVDATSSKKAQLGGVDVHVQGV